MRIAIMAVAIALVVLVLPAKEARADWCEFNDQGGVDCFHSPGTHLELYAGWNLIAGQGLSVDAVVRLCPATTVIQGWDAEAMTWELWAPGLPVVDFTEMERHRGYWTYCDEEPGWWRSATSD